MDGTIESFDSRLQRSKLFRTLDFSLISRGVGEAKRNPARA